LAVQQLATKFTRSPTLPLLSYGRNLRTNGRSCVKALPPGGKKFIVVGVSVPDVCEDSEIDRLGRKALGRGGAADATRVSLARVLGDVLLLGAWAARIMFGNFISEGSHIPFVEVRPTLGLAMPAKRSGLSVIETLTLGALKSFFFDEYSLTLITFTSATEAKDHRAEGRVLARTSRQGRIATGKKNQVVKISAGYTENNVAFFAQELALPQLGPAF